MIPSRRFAYPHWREPPLPAPATEAPLKPQPLWVAGSTTCSIRSERLSKAKEVSTMAKDPVCGMEVEEQAAAATSVYKGQTY